jgi:hypothetical protein
LNTVKLLISLSENPTLTQHDTSQYEEHYHDDNQNHDDAIGLSQRKCMGVAELR